MVFAEIIIAHIDKEEKGDNPGENFPSDYEYSANFVFMAVYLLAFMLSVNTALD